MDLNDIVLTPQQMRDAETAAAAHGVSVSLLMKNAGEALGSRVLNTAERLMKKNVLLICGNGNNGGDGYVAADFLLDSSADITIIACGPPKTDLSKTAFAGIEGRCEIIPFEDALEDTELIDRADIIVDCVFGIGFHGELSDELKRLFMRCALSSAYLISCDCPSGINCLNGRCSSGAFKADETITFHKPKLGMFISPAKEHCGRISTADIGIGDYAGEYAKVKIMRTDAELAASFLPHRPEDSHKGTFGKVVMVCGSLSYPGAALISSEAALRSGAGIVNLCTNIKAVGHAVERMPECTYTVVDLDENGCITEKAADAILSSMETAGAAVIGCGLGRTVRTEELVCELIRRAKCPLIIDADGINCLSAHIDVLKEKQTEIILTPHPAELARLCGTDTASVMQDLFGHACKLAEQYNVTVHAKNTQTLTVCKNDCYITDFGCSALAKGGSGDMLAGLIGGLIAQGIDADRACVLADYIMGASAKALCREVSPRGVVAGDIIKRFPRTFYELEHGL